MKTGDLKEVFWLQDPLDHGLYAQWFKSPETNNEWVFNYRQKELLESTPLHTFANKKYFHISELSGSKNCLVKGGKAQATNAEYVTRLTIDIDEPVTLEEIERHELLSDHLRTTKIKTHSLPDGRANWQIIIHLKPVHKRNFGRLREVHKALYDLWERGEFTVDTCLIGDWTRCDRYNAHDRGNRKNYKYSELNEVVTVEQGPTYELCEVVEWLEGQGYRFTRHKTFDSSFKKVREYFYSNQTWEGKNQDELAEQLAIRPRTLRLVLSRIAAKGNGKKKDPKTAELVMNWQGSTRPVNTRTLIITSNIYRFKGEFPRRQQHIKRIKRYARAPLGNRSNKKNKQWISVIEMYKGQNVPLGKRNSVVYAITRELDFRYNGKLTPETALAYIKSKFTFDDPHTFTNNEILKTVKSALRAKYKYPLSRETLLEWGLIPDNYRQPDMDISISRVSPPTVAVSPFESYDSKYPYFSRLVKIRSLADTEYANHDYRRGPPH